MVQIYHIERWPWYKKNHRNIEEIIFWSLVFSSYTLLLDTSTRSHYWLQPWQNAGDGGAQLLACQGGVAGGQGGEGDQK